MSQEILDQVMEILRQRQGAVDQANRGVQSAQQGLQRASAPVNTQFANPGQSFGQVMGDGTGAQRQAMVRMGAEMARDSSRVPGAAMASGFDSGFQLLDQIRRSQRKQGMEQAATGVTSAQQRVKAAQDARDAMPKAYNAAAQAQFAENERDAKSQAPNGVDKITEVNGRDVGLNSSGEIVVDYGPSESMIKENNRIAEEQAAAQAAAGDAKRAEITKARNLMETTDITLDNIDKAIRQSDKWFATGAAAYAPDWLNPQSRDLKKRITQIVSTIGFDRLQRMRDESPTGGALGQVSERELDQLNAALGDLRNTQSEEQLDENLRTVRRVYSGIMQKVQAFLESEQDEALLQEYL